MKRTSEPLPKIPPNANLPHGYNPTLLERSPELITGAPYDLMIEAYRSYSRTHPDVVHAPYFFIRIFNYFVDASHVIITNPNDRRICIHALNALDARLIDPVYFESESSFLEACKGGYLSNVQLMIVSLNKDAKTIQRSSLVDWN